jgi:hypothetical protein
LSENVQQTAPVSNLIHVCMYVCMETLLSYTCISLPENRHKPDGVYSLSENVQRRGDVKRFYRQNYRGIQTEIAVQ